MNKKWIWVAAVAFPLLLLLGATLYLSSLDFNRFKPTITAMVAEATGRELTVLGDVELQLSTSPRLSVEGVQFANVSWGSRQEMVTIQRMVAEVDLWSLFGDAPEVVHLLLEQPDILLERSRNGDVNWQVDAKKTIPQETSTGRGVIPRFNRVEIRDARITYVDGGKATRESLRIRQLQASAEHFAAPLHLQMAGDYNSTPFDITFRLDSLESLAAGEETPLRLDLALEQIEAQLSTRLLLDGEHSHYQLGEIDLQLAQSRLQGGLSVDAGTEQPKLRATLKAPLLDLTMVTSVLPAKMESAEIEVDIPQQERSQPEKLFSSKPFELMGLHAVDAVVDLQIEKLISPYAVIEALEAKTTLSGGHLQVEPLQFMVGGGRVESRLSLKEAGPLILDMGLHGRKISLGQMLAGVDKTDQLQGLVSELDIVLQGKGVSPAALMADLSGKILLQSGEGKINNRYLNLTGGDVLSQLTASLNPAAKSEPLTLLQCAVVNLKINQGSCEFDKKLAVETDQMVIVGSGEFNLGNETLTIQMKPSPRQDTADLGIGAGDLVAAARLEGTFALPKLGLDPLGSAKAGVKLYQALATGGTSLILGGLIDKALADPHPCKTALGDEQN